MATPAPLTFRGRTTYLGLVLSQLPSQACIEWPGGRDKDGYGKAKLRGKSLRAHRFVYEQTGGTIPEGLHLDHLCRNPGCVNPTHLEPVTNGENLLRGDTVNARNAAKTHCKRGHPFDEENTRLVPRGRECKACRRLMERARYPDRYARRKAARSTGLLAGAVMVGLLVTATPAPAVALEPTTATLWRAPVALSTQLSSPMTSVNRMFRMGDDGQPMDGPILPGQVVSMGSIHTLREIAPILEPGAWVMYDLERWPHTSDWEQRHPRNSMQRFIDAGHARGFQVVLAPSGYFRDKAIGLQPDAFHAQVQHIHDPAAYKAKVCEIARVTDGPVIAQLTVSRHNLALHSVEGLMRQYRAGLTCTSHFALWGGQSPETLAIAQDFVSLVT